MGLFDNIIGTANDGEEATDMDTIIENLEHTQQPREEEGTQDVSDTITEVADTSGSTGGGGTSDDTGSAGDQKGSSKHADEKHKKTHKMTSYLDDTPDSIDGVEDTSGSIDEIVDIDIGGDMSVIDISSTEELTESTPQIHIIEETPTIEAVSDTTNSPDVSENPTIIPADPALMNNNNSPMSTESVTSLLDITEPIQGGNILDMGISMTPEAPISEAPISEAPISEAPISEVPVLATIVIPAVSPIEMPLPPSTPSTAPVGGSLGDKIGGFADELRGLRAADEILLQEKQDAKIRLEDAKKAIQVAEDALDTEIQRIRDDEAAIDDTLASLKKR